MDASRAHFRFETAKDWDVDCGQVIGGMKINKLSDQLNWSVIILFGFIRVRSCGDARGQPLPAHLPPASRCASNGSSLGI